VTLADAVNKLTYNGVYVSLGSQANLQEAAAGIAGTRSLTFENNSGFKDPHYAQLFETASIEPDAGRRTLSAPDVRFVLSGDTIYAGKELGIHSCYYIPDGEQTAALETRTGAEILVISLPMYVRAV